MPSFGDLDDGHFLPFCATIEKKIAGNADFKESSSFVRTNENFQCMVWGADYGQFNNGGHAHNDLGAISLNYQKVPIFIDCGTSTYSNHKIRNQFRSINCHSVPSFGYEPRTLPTFLMFSFPDRVRPEISLLSDQNLIKVLYGNYQFERRIKLDRDLFVDKTEWSQSKSFSIIYPLSPRVLPIQIDEFSSDLILPNQIRLRVVTNSPHCLVPVYFARHYDAREVTLGLLSKGKSNQHEIQVFPL
jgi:hypothetical protein